MSQDPEPASTESWNDDLQAQLLERMVQRLEDGEILISPAHYTQALSADYEEITGGPPQAEALAGIEFVADKVIDADREAYAVLGIENWITRTYLAQAQQAKLSITQIQENGTAPIRDLVKQDKVRALMGQMDLMPTRLNLRRCLSRVVRMVAGKGDRTVRRPRAAAPSKPVAPAEQTGDGRRVYRMEAVGAPSEAETEMRNQEQQRRRQALQAEQQQHLMQNLDSYVEGGRLSAGEAKQLGKLAKIDAAVQQGRVSEERASKVRNSLIEGKVRFELERKVRDVVDAAVTYLQLFEGLARVEPKYDLGLRFLARHKQTVCADGIGRNELGPLVRELLKDIDTLRALVGILDREDAEVRMMAATLPPYSRLGKKGGEPPARLTVEEGFIDDLRGLGHDEVIDRLNAVDAKVRVRLAADMICLHALVSRLIKPTPVRKELRILKINMIIEEFYRETDDMEEARGKAQVFLRTRLQRLYPDLTEEENQEIEQRSNEMLDAVEEKIREERLAAKKEAGARVDEAGDETADLSDAEVRQGVVIGRVAVRVAGSTRMMPYKIMPDPEAPDTFVLAQRDPSSGQTVPVMRRGAKRIVKKRDDGRWELV